MNTNFAPQNSNFSPEQLLRLPQHLLRTSPAAAHTRRCRSPRRKLQFGHEIATGALALLAIGIGAFALMLGMKNSNVETTSAQSARPRSSTFRRR